MKSYGQADLSFCGVPRDADWTLVIPDPMLRVGSALGFSHMQPEHAQRDIENGASIARGRRTIFYPNAMVMGDTARLEYKHIPWSRHSFRIVCGGFPCQMAAPQGLQLAWDDPRAEQALHFIAAVDANKPHVAVYENVYMFWVLMNKKVDFSALHRQPNN